MEKFTIDDLQKALHKAEENQPTERKTEESNKWRKRFRGFFNLFKATELADKAQYYDVKDLKTFEEQGKFYQETGEYHKAIGSYRNVLEVAKEVDDKRWMGRAHLNMGNTYMEIGEYHKAIDCHRKHFEIAKELGDKRGIGGAYGNMGISYTRIGEYQNAIECHRKDLEIAEELSDKGGIGRAHANMGNAYSRIGEHQKAIECHQKWMEIAEELGDKGGIGGAHVNIGNAYSRLGEYEKAIDCYRKDLEIAEELGDTGVKARAYRNMGITYNNIGEYQKAIDYHRKHLEIAEEVGNKRWEGSASANMGSVFHNLGEYQKAIDCYRKQLKISEELGDKGGIGRAHTNIGNIYNSIGEYQKAVDCHRKYLEIAEELGDKTAIGGAHANMGAAYHDLGEYQKAIDCHRKDLEIAEVLSDKRGIGRAHANMGNVYDDFGEYQKAIDCHRKYLQVAEELGDKRGIGKAHGNMANAYNGIGAYEKAFDSHCKHLEIAEELGDKFAMGGSHSGMGIVYNNIGEYQKAIDCHRKHLAISEELGNKAGVGRAHSNMGCSYRHIGEYEKAIDCHTKHLKIAEEISDKSGVGTAYCNLGTSYSNIGEYQKGLDFFGKFLEISEEIGNLSGVAIAQSNLGEFHQTINDRLACSFFAKSILSYQRMRRSSVYQDDFNTSMSNTYAEVHKLLLKSLLNLKQVQSALLVSDSGKAKALYDLTRRYADIAMDSALEESFTIPIQAISDDPCSTTTEAFLGAVLSKVINLMQDGNIVSYSFDRHQNLHAWVISRKGVFHKQWQTTNGISARTYVETVNRGLSDCVMRNLPKNVELFTNAEVDKFDANVKKKYHDPTFIGIDDERAKFTRDLERIIEDLSRNKKARKTISCDPNILVLKSLKERYNLESSSRGQNEKSSDEDKDKLVGVYSLERPKILSSQIKEEIPNHRGDPTEQDTAIETYLKKQYSIYISPIEEYLVGSKMLIVPEGSLFKTPFCALLNTKKEHLCDRYSLQFTPALHVLNASLSKPLPKIGPALFVGNPIVGDVKYNDEVTSISQLANAKVEVKECSKYFNAEPLLEEKATKENVLNSMKDASVIHIAAHGHMNNADIFLAPNEGAPKPPSEEHYLLTAKDVVECTLKARLVVLSCCHSGRGQISAEGVVGIARSFLGAGARSVLVTLWRILDAETMEFMKLFYENIIRGVSVCVALQQTMVEMKKKYAMAAWSYFQIVGEDISLSKDEIETIRRHSAA